MRKLFTFIFALLAMASFAADTRITLTIAITNSANCTNGTVLTINSSSRMATNTASYTATTWVTNLTTAGLKTNLFFQIAAYPIGSPRLILKDIGDTNFALIAEKNQALSVSSTDTNWASFTLSTQTVSSAIGVRVPMTVEYSTNANYIASLLVTNLEEFATNRFSAGAAALSNYVSLYGSQTLSNKLFRTSKLLSPVTTNLVNYGNAISSPGGGDSSEQFGNGANATTNYALAIGSGAQATSIDAVAIGLDAQATNDASVSIGGSSISGGTNSIAIGISAKALLNNSIALGESAEAGHSNSIAIGRSSATTKADQIMLGSSAHTTEIGGNLNVANTNTVNRAYITNLFGSGGVIADTVTTNIIHAGSNTVTGDLSITPLTTTALANGNNTLVATNTIIKISPGPDAAYAVCSISGGRSGRILTLINACEAVLTLPHESGYDGTVANRIKTFNAADATVTTNGVATLMYDAGINRWRILNIYP